MPHISTLGYKDILHSYVALCSSNMATTFLSDSEADSHYTIFVYIDGLGLVFTSVYGPGLNPKPSVVYVLRTASAQNHLLPLRLNYIQSLRHYPKTRFGI